MKTIMKLTLLATLLIALAALLACGSGADESGEFFAASAPAPQMQAMEMADEAVAGRAMAMSAPAAQVPAAPAAPAPAQPAAMEKEVIREVEGESFNVTGHSASPAAAQSSKTSRR